MSQSSSMPPTRTAVDTGFDIVNVFLSHANRVAENCPSYQMQSAPLAHAGMFTEALIQPVVLNDGSVFHVAAGTAFVASHEESVLMVKATAVSVEAAPTASANASRITFTRAVAFLKRALSSVVQT